LRLDRLLGDLEVLETRGDPGATEVTAITHDSGSVVPGALFCCVPGERRDGHDFAPAAVAAGAAALLCERVLTAVPVTRVPVAQVIVPSVRRAMGPAAATLFDHPSRRTPVVGVTGTNGKTTTTHLLAAALQAAGRPAEVIGTLSGARTTPEAPELQARLAELAAREATAAVEVSSHALAQHRVDATWFSVAVFTNLSQDHLDFHLSMDDYFATKARLFTAERAAVAVVNTDDLWGRRLLEMVTGSLPTRPFSLADAADLEVGPGGSTFRWAGQPVRLRLGGVFNVTNALAAAFGARELGADAGAVAEGLSSVVSVPGRFEEVDAGQSFTVVVDYAHTPASLEQVLTAARRIASGAGNGSGAGRVLVVFGCGGDRDRAKRPAMGEAATRLADLAVLTSDNPRREDPLAIIEEVRAGVSRPEVLVVEPDRRAAIAGALASARPGDVVVVAGKGHEAVQVTGDEVVPFDDRVVVREELARQGVNG
jgi:UDP-N-acetylmuramoyl-L-alanyl-D-glutamate--2,6-diaminopimelate ligase